MEDLSKYTGYSDDLDSFDSVYNGLTDYSNNDNTINNNQNYTMYYNSHTCKACGFFVCNCIVYDTMLHDYNGPN